jgi:hypothetical protein
MNQLELYINKEKGGFHNFIVVAGTRRFEPEVPFTSQSIDEMFLKAKEIIEAGGFVDRLRVYDPGRIMLKHGDGVSWVSLKQLGLWTLPKGQSQPVANESILGRFLGAAPVQLQAAKA